MPPTNEDLAPGNENAGFSWRDSVQNSVLFVKTNKETKLNCTHLTS